jgi:hypothetical protein
LKKKREAGQAWRLNQHQCHHLRQNLRQLLLLLLLLLWLLRLT